MRLLPAVVVLLAACCLSGCTTVSPLPPPAPADPAPPRGAPRLVTLTPPPALPLLATVRPDTGGPVAATPPDRTRAPRHLPAAPVPHRKRPVRHPAPRPALPAGASPCALGRTYGGWAAGSAAATTCARVYGRATAAGRTR